MCGWVGALQVCALVCHGLYEGVLGDGYRMGGLGGTVLTQALNIDTASVVAILRGLWSLGNWV